MFNFLSRSSASPKDDAFVKIAALEVLSSNVMVADEDYNIVYINPSLFDFLQEAEGVIRTDLPHFKTSELIGQNIDIFFKDPSHQHGMLDDLKSEYKTTITMGGTIFVLMANPLANDEGQRIGTVVEWSDASLLNSMGQVDAINKSAAVIEFELDGTIIEANENFCGAVGYDLSEIQGKHHSIFVDPVESEAEEYKTFWEELRNGKFQSAKYKRFGKGGKEIWIEASYNPIMDYNGKPFKVVKYATDITDQMKLIAEVRNLVDENVKEIEGAARNAAEQATAGATASEQTSHNVQAVASGAEELSASVREIAQSMARSREAAEKAFESAEAADRATQALSDAATAMGGVVDMIQNIAGQINLLALNATIESARAGEAGKGFAVVASEVKNLSRQATEATDEISKEIEGMQSVSDNVVTALASIKESIDTVREFVTSTASAVEEQSAVAGEMSSNMQQASSAVSGISDNINEIVSSIGGVEEATQKTREAAKTLSQ